MVFILGKDIRGSSRWINIGSFSFQPSEFTKLCLVIALAKYLHDDPKSEGRTLSDLVVPALIAAVRAQRLETVQRLLGSGADPDLTGRDGFAPLYWAVYKRNRAIADLLLAAGASPGTYSLEGLQ